MKYKTLKITVPGQQAGAANLNAYLLDAISIAPEKVRPAVLICPGGGYERCSDREQEPVVMKFLSMGCHAFVLQYSVSPHRFPVALRETAQAAAVIRGYAAQWHVNPDALVVCGFSAGGHLACSIGTFWNNPVAYEAIGRTPEQIKPNGLILSYPVITAGEFGHVRSFRNLLGEEATAGQYRQVSLEEQVTADMPPVFLWHTITDQTVPVENSLLLATALQRNRVNFELHIYPEGGHGLSLANKETGGSEKCLTVPCCQSWISLVQLWIETKYMAEMESTLRLGEE